MLSPLTRKRLTIALGLLLLPPLTGCGTDRVRFVPPPPERMAAVPAPVIPPATTPCSFDPKSLCNSDEETGQVLAGYDAALAKANEELQWLRTFFAAVPTKPK